VRYETHTLASAPAAARSQPAVQEPSTTTTPTGASTRPRALGRLSRHRGSDTASLRAGTKTSSSVMDRKVGCRGGDDGVGTAGKYPALAKDTRRRQGLRVIFTAPSCFFWKIS
jgi:hypothetical protein